MAPWHSGCLMPGIYSFRWHFRRGGGKLDVPCGWHWLGITESIVPHSRLPQLEGHVHQWHPVSCWRRASPRLVRRRCEWNSCQTPRKGVFWDSDRRMSDCYLHGIKPLRFLSPISRCPATKEVHLRPLPFPHSKSRRHRVWVSFTICNLNLNSNDDVDCKYTANLK